MLRELFAALKPGGVLFSSNPRGNDDEGWNRGRYGAYHDLETWRRYLTVAGFAELDHYYRPPGLPREQRNRAILVGIVAATVLRIVFASITTWLLAVVGLLVAGGLLLLWVCWKMWRELRATASHPDEDALADEGLDGSGPNGQRAPRKTFAQAAWQIVIADVSMSLDNVLAVAGAAREHPIVLIFGLALSIALMGIASVGERRSAAPLRSTPLAAYRARSAPVTPLKDRILASWKRGARSIPLRIAAAQQDGG